MNSSPPSGYRPQRTEAMPLVAQTPILRERNVRIDHLPPGFGVAELRELCRNYGRVIRATTREMRDTHGWSFGLAEFDTEEHAAAAIRGLDGKWLPERFYPDIPSSQLNCMHAYLTEPLAERPRPPRTEPAQPIQLPQSSSDMWQMQTPYMDQQSCWQAVMEYAQHWYSVELKHVYQLTDENFMTVLNSVATDIASQPFVSIDKLGEILANKYEFFSRFARCVMLQPKLAI